MPPDHDDVTTQITRPPPDHRGGGRNPRPARHSGDSLPELPLRSDRSRRAAEARSTARALRAIPVGRWAAAAENREGSSADREGCWAASMVATRAESLAAPWVDRPGGRAKPVGTRCSGRPGRLLLHSADECGSWAWHIGGAELPCRRHREPAGRQDSAPSCLQLGIRKS